MTPDRLEELSVPLVKAILAECETDGESCDALLRLCLGTISSVLITFINPDAWERVAQQMVSETIRVTLKIFVAERDAEPEGEIEK